MTIDVTNKMPDEFKNITAWPWVDQVRLSWGPWCSSETSRVPGLPTRLFPKSQSGNGPWCVELDERLCLLLDMQRRAGKDMHLVSLSSSLEGAVILEPWCRIKPKKHPGSGLRSGTRHPGYAVRGALSLPHERWKGLSPASTMPLGCAQYVLVRVGKSPVYRLAPLDALAALKRTAEPAVVGYFDLLSDIAYSLAEASRSSAAPRSKINAKVHALISESLFGDLAHLTAARNLLEHHKRKQEMPF